MKKISFLGIVLGFIAGALVALLSGSWIFWLAVGMAIGVVLGTAGARRTHSTLVRHGQTCDGEPDIVT